MESKDLLKKVSDALGKKAGEKTAEKEQQEKERRELVTSIGKDIAESLRPYMEGMAKQSQITKEDLKAALSEVHIQVPESNVHIPEIRIPEARVKVELPEIKLPQFNIPASNVTYPDRMMVNIDGVDNLKPLPVMMMDTKGNPMSFSVGGGGGGKTDFLTIKGFSTSAFSQIQNPDGRLKVELPSGGSGLTDAELRASSLLVNQLSGANWSVSVSDIFGSTGTGFYNGDNRLRVSLETGGSGLTDSELRASPVQILQVSGAIDSVSVIGTVPVSGTFFQATQPVSVASTLDVQQVSGANWSINVLTMPAVVVTSVTNSIATALIDSTGAQYSGSNPVPVNATLSGSLTSTVVVGDIPAGTVDTGSAPVKVGGIARTTNPVAEADGDRLSFSTDDLGRQITRPVQMRDLIRTAYVSLATGTETTLLAAVAGAYLDLIMIVASNNSDAAVSVDIRPVTAGNIVNTLRIPANGTAGWTPSVPWPQTDTGNNWTVDGPDDTGRTLTFSALFSQEI